MKRTSQAIRVAGIALLVATIMGLTWRRLSRSHALPCPTWLAWILEGPIMDRVLGTDMTLDRMGIHAGQCILEVGPGPGRLLVPAAHRVRPGGEVVGLDIQAGMLDRLRTRAAREGVSNLAVVLGDATRPHFRPGSFDLIYFCTVLGEIPDRRAALEQCHAALKLEGRLSITEMFPDPHYQSRSTIRQLAKAAGFRLESIIGPWYLFTANFVKA